jgi:hypothetical protein
VLRPEIVNHQTQSQPDPADHVVSQTEPFNQGKLVTAQQVQLFQKRILLAKWFPGRAIQTQGVGKTPGIQVIALGPAGSFSISVRSSRFGVKRINCAIGRLKQLVDHSALTSFDGHCSAT